MNKKGDFPRSPHVFAVKNVASETCFIFVSGAQGSRRRWGGGGNRQGSLASKIFLSGKKIWNKPKNAGALTLAPHKKNTERRMQVFVFSFFWTRKIRGRRKEDTDTGACCPRLWVPLRQFVFLVLFIFLSSSSTSTHCRVLQILFFVFRYHGGNFWNWDRRKKETHFSCRVLGPKKQWNENYDNTHVTKKFKQKTEYFHYLQ